MKTVGKQLQAARLARNWTPELAARETKIKVDRLRDLEADNYSHFTSPAYARGFVRTYARALGLDEYTILRQLDNKLPDDDTPNLVTDSNVGYLPETSMPPLVARRDYTGLYVVLTLGFVVVLIFAFVLFEAYRVGELPKYFASASQSDATPPEAPAGVSTNAARALPVDSNTPPAVVAVPDAASTNAAPAAPKALPVDLNALANDTNAAPVAPKALPVDPSELTNAPTAAVAAPVPAVAAVPAAASTAAPVAPRALPVDPSELAAAPAAPAPAPVPAVIPSISARQSNSAPVVQSATSLAAASQMVAPVPTANSPSSITPATTKRLVLTASQDSFIRVTLLDTTGTDKALYASVLRGGQSIGFDGRKFSINVGVPSAVDIQLDGVNYGPHSDQETPETFTVESHQP